MVFFFRSSTILMTSLFCPEFEAAKTARSFRSIFIAWVHPSVMTGVLNPYFIVA
jgi:hypothetical protein